MVKVLYVELPNRMYDELQDIEKKRNKDLRKGWLRDITMKLIQEHIDRERIK